MCKPIVHFQQAQHGAGGVGSDYCIMMAIDWFILGCPTDPETLHKMAHFSAIRVLPLWKSFRTNMVPIMSRQDPLPSMAKHAEQWLNAIYTAIWKERKNPEPLIIKDETVFLDSAAAAKTIPDCCDKGNWVVWWHSSKGGKDLVQYQQGLAGHAVGFNQEKQLLMDANHGIFKIPDKQTLTKVLLFSMRIWSIEFIHLYRVRSLKPLAD